MPNSSTATASPAKLRNGDWGAKVSGPVQAGDTVTITTRSGKTWESEIADVLSSTDGISLCTTVQRSSRRSSRRRMGSGHGAASPVPGYSKYCTDQPGCGCYDCE